nr:glutathione peroxidase [uncultured Schaedlerella sp.]
MNRNKKGAMPEITKKEYEKIKKSDRQEFAAFCEGMYKRGYEDGMESVPGVDLEEVMAAVARARGVGKRALDNIRDCVEQLFRKEDENE